MPNDTDATKKNSQGSAEPQRFIRTYAGDMATVQEGGVPDLAPLNKTSHDLHPELSGQEKPQGMKEIPIPPPIRAEELPKVRPVPPPSPPPSRVPPIVVEEPLRVPPLEKIDVPPPPPPAPPPPPPAPEPPPVLSESDQEREVTLNRLRAKVAQSQTEGRPFPLEEPSPIHTYAEDFSDHVKEQKASTMTVLAAEQDAGRYREGRSESPVRGILSFIAGIILIAAGGIGAFYAYQQRNGAPQSNSVGMHEPIVVDERVNIDGEGSVLMQAIAASAASPLTSGTIRLLYSTNATTTRLGLFTVMRPQAPDLLLRNISGEGSMAGVISTAAGQGPFFIVSVNSYNDTFAAMLSWEPRMLGDLGSLYPTLSSATTTVPIFHDAVVANHDVRVARDASGKSMLLYGYWSKSTLVIARDETAFTEILSRLANSGRQ